MAACIDDKVSGDDLDTILSLLDDDFFEEDQEIVEAMVSSVNEVSYCVYFMYKRHAEHPILRDFWLGPTPFLWCEHELLVYYLPVKMFYECFGLRKRYFYCNVIFVD